VEGSGAPFSYQGRILSWTPSAVDCRRALSAGHPELSVRFVKETALQSRSSLVPEVHFLDLSVRQDGPLRRFSGAGLLIDSSYRRIWRLIEFQETLHVRTEPVLLQLPIVPVCRLEFAKQRAW
jgi:hypothetical protein